MLEGGYDPPGREERYWDATVRGVRPEVAIDPALAETIARVHDLDDVPAPDPVFVARLEDALVHAVLLAGSGGTTRVPGPNGATASPPLRSPALRIGPRPGAPGRTSRGRWALAQLAMAALLFTTLAVGYLAFRPHPDNRGHPDATGYGATTVIPAPASWSNTLLLRAELKPVMEGSIGVRLDRWSFLPGSGEWRGAAPTLPQLLYVEAGRLTVTVDRAATLSRATSVKRGGAVVPLESPLNLRSGDLLAIPADAQYVLRPDVAAAPTLLVVTLSPAADPGPTASVPPESSVQALGMGILDGLPGGSAVLTLRRLTAGPGTSIPSEITAGPELLVVESGAVGLRAGMDAPEVTWTAGDGGAVVAMGTRLDLSNPGDEMLTVLRLAIVPADSGSATPSA